MLSLKTILEFINIFSIVTIITLLFLNSRLKLFVSLLSIFALSVLSLIGVIQVFHVGTIEYFYPGSLFSGSIRIKADLLSAWFMAIISFSFAMGMWYGYHYLKPYLDNPIRLNIHLIAILLSYVSLIDICVVQNGFIFLVVWEIMAISTFLTVIFESHKNQVLKAGIYYFIISHVGVLLLTIGVIWLFIHTGNFDFALIPGVISQWPAYQIVILFFIFFIGFGIKAGFFPFHTWLPHAHPAAPAHISGLMSGVIIKIGIYGIMRILLFMNNSYTTIGYIIIVIAAITGVYGVMLAIVQHNLKKLLAYHSIENIGIIGIGIGLGSIGLGMKQPILAYLGFGGALLHVWNHALFKSLLFYVAGNIYQSTHSVNVEKLGGLIRTIPQSACFFLIASIAISGLPPFNGFISEFLIYSGLFHGFTSNTYSLMFLLLLIIISLVVIGGLAVICFTKAFGIVFLGNPRDHSIQYQPNDTWYKNLPLLAIALVIVIIGIFPSSIIMPLNQVTTLFWVNSNPTEKFNLLNSPVQQVGWVAALLIISILLLWFIKKLVQQQQTIRYHVTWGCGYTGSMQKMQYTASSFIRSYRKLTEPILLIHKKKEYPKAIYPKKIEHQTHAEDHIERIFIDKPTQAIRKLLNYFAFIQNGNIQLYILYGFIFLVVVLLFPIVITKLRLVLDYLNSITW
ncbi:MAG: proton-conducting transporter membrane subunit [Bacteroidales bacterium]